MVSRYAVTPRVITIAVSTIACGSGSLISSRGVTPMIGAPPAGPETTRNKMFTPFEASSTPIRIRVSDRSSSR